MKRGVTAQETKNHGGQDQCKRDVLRAGNGGPGARWRIAAIAAAILFVAWQLTFPTGTGIDARADGLRGASAPSLRAPVGMPGGGSGDLPRITMTRAERRRALRNPNDPLWTEPAPAVYRVRIETTQGDIVLEVTRLLAPRGADRFYHLVEAGFYDNSRFYRVIAGRFAQFGIAGNPAIAQIWRNARFPDDPVRASNVRGTFAFAMTGPNARTTQIYINTGNQSRLDAMGFAPFGKVAEGMDIVDKLYAGYAERSGGGMRAGHQGKLFEQGNAYLDREFPLLDKLLSATIAPPTSPYAR